MIFLFCIVAFNVYNSIIYNLSTYSIEESGSNSVLRIVEKKDVESILHSIQYRGCFNFFIK